MKKTNVFEKCQNSPRLLNSKGYSKIFSDIRMIFVFNFIIEMGLLFLHVVGKKVVIEILECSSL